MFLVYSGSLNQVDHSIHASLQGCMFHRPHSILHGFTALCLKTRTREPVMPTLQVLGGCCPTITKTEGRALGSHALRAKKKPILPCYDKLLAGRHKTLGLQHEPDESIQYMCHSSQTGPDGMIIYSPRLTALASELATALPPLLTALD